MFSFMNRGDRFNPKKGLKRSMLLRHGQTRNPPARRSAAKEGNPKPETRNPKPETRNLSEATSDNQKLKKSDIKKTIQAKFT